MKFADSEKLTLSRRDLLKIGAVASGDAVIPGGAREYLRQQQQLDYLFLPDAISADYDVAQDSELSVLPPEYRNFLLAETFSSIELRDLLVEIASSEAFADVVNISILLRNDEDHRIELHIFPMEGAYAFRVIDDLVFDDASRNVNAQFATAAEALNALIDRLEMIAEGYELVMHANSTENSMTFSTKMDTTIWINAEGPEDEKVRSRSIIASGEYSNESPGIYALNFTATEVFRRGYLGDQPDKYLTVEQSELSPSKNGSPFPEQSVTFKTQAFLL